MCLRLLLVLILAASYPAQARAQVLQGTAFSYQGKLVQNDAPANGLQDLVFELFDAPVGGAQIGPTLVFSTANGNPVLVSEGVFTVALDFGAAAFEGPGADSRWLRVTVNGSVLAPRSKIENAPFALAARAAELAFTVPVSSIGASEVDATQVQLRGAATSCASGDFVRAIGASGDVTCATDAVGEGDITGVGAGTGLTGGGASGSVTLAVDTSLIQARGATTSCPMGSLMRGIDATGNVVCAADANSGGTITGVVAGSGLTGGGNTGSVPLAADPNVVQSRVAMTCPPESSIRAIDANGAVTCEGDSFGATGTGWALSGDGGTTAGVNFLGTTDDQPLELKVRGSRGLRIEPTDQTQFSGQVNVIGGAAANAVNVGARGATIGGGGSGDSNGANRVSDSFGTVAGGSNNVAGNLSGVATDAVGATVGGGTSNQAAGDASTVAGGNSNIAGGIQAFVGGGQSNAAIGLRAVIGGGVNNAAPAENSTIAGGSQNTASGLAASIGGGTSNEVGGLFSVVPGGLSNSASGVYSVALGGLVNIASGAFSTTAGGLSNVAAADHSFAAGRNATVRGASATGEAGCQDTGFCGDEGTIVFADSSLGAFTSDGANRFLVRATGGVKFVSAIDAGGVEMSGVHLPAGSGAWDSLSDRDSKSDFLAVDPARILAALLDLPITRWRYRAQDASIAHLGPMAQDFHAAFGLGTDERHISTVDADGVALAAIQGLNAKLEDNIQRLQRENERLMRENRAIAERMTRIETLLLDLETTRAALEPNRPR